MNQTNIPLQPASASILDTKYLLKDIHGNPIDKNMDDMFIRVAKTLASIETDPEYWYKEFLYALQNGATPAGRILANVGADEHKPHTSTINCLGGDTLVMTDKGSIPIKDLANGTLTKVLNGNGNWVDVEFKSFGEQAVHDVIIRGLDIYGNHSTRGISCTANHRWVTKLGVVDIAYLLNLVIPMESYILKAPAVQNAPQYTIVEISDLIYVTEVFCCEEKETQSFCLDGMLLTGNCVVSADIKDSLDDILHKAHLAGLTLKPGSGIGYCFSTLRPRNALVKGVGAKTSGPLSFMDIYDKMCFTISSAGGRRGAQMATFDINHPDVIDFINAKKEKGRLRQFNLSLLITAYFIDAVLNDKDWMFNFPITEKEFSLDPTMKVIHRYITDSHGYKIDENGLTVCKVYKTIKAKDLWRLIMESTYYKSEPGFLLIDNINEMNNLWFIETITATNPCMSGNMRLHTDKGLVRLEDLEDVTDDIFISVDGRIRGINTESVLALPITHVFKTSLSSEVFRIETEEGFAFEATADHKMHTSLSGTPSYMKRVEELEPGDNLALQYGQGLFGKNDDLVLAFAFANETLISLIEDLPKECYSDNISLYYYDLRRSIDERVIYSSMESVKEYKQFSQLRRCNYKVDNISGYYKLFKVPEYVYQGTKECVRVYLKTFSRFCNRTVYKKESVLKTTQKSFLQEIQLLLLNFNIYSLIDETTSLSGEPQYYYLKIPEEMMVIYETDIINGKDFDYSKRTTELKLKYSSATVKSVTSIGYHPVYDATQPDTHTLIANGFITSNCGEQPLPPNGACLLGSINLTKMIDNPFTPTASFNWGKYKKLIKVFTRMLDNVVEFNGLPLEDQRDEIYNKRRHGMGYYGLCSALTMMGVKYGSDESITITEEITKILSLEGYCAGVELAIEKGPAPVMEQEVTITPRMLHQSELMRDDRYCVKGSSAPVSTLMYRYSPFIRLLIKEARKLNDLGNSYYLDTLKKIETVGLRSSHFTTIPPTGTTALTIGNNASGGLEPSFAHEYSRNLIVADKKSKEKVNVYSYELLLYRELINPNASPYATGENTLPDYFVNADEITPLQHIKVQAAAQKFIDSSCSKTINCPTDISFTDFEHIYLDAIEHNLKGCTTFRFNPEVFQGVLVKEEDLRNTMYKFKSIDGTEVEVSGDTLIKYDGEDHTAANLFDAIHEGYYAKL